MLRVAWLGLFVAVSFGGWAAFGSAREPAYPVVDRTAKTSRAPANEVASVEMPVAAATDTLSKSDRLDAGHQQIATAPATVPVTSTPPTESKPAAAPVAGASRLVSRHWHDPHDPKFRRERPANQAAGSSKDSSSKGKSAKGTTSGSDRRLQANAACKDSSGWNTLRRALNMPATGC